MQRRPRLTALAVLIALPPCGGELALAESPRIEPLVRTVDLDIGEARTVELCDGSKADVRVLGLDETRDPIRGAVRRAVADVEVNGVRVSLVSATYRLPRAAGGVRIDCPVTRGYRERARPDRWGLEKDVRLRLWPAGSPLVAPGTFIYPARQRWFASDTQMANVPAFVDAGETPGAGAIYYHYGLDIGGAEGMVDIVSATAGLVVSVGEDVLREHRKGTPVDPRYDVVYILDDRGWYYRYSHLQSIDAGLLPGKRIEIGTPVGVLGKEGGSGGWSHLHFDITARQPSGKWGIQEGYAFLWEAYVRQHHPAVIAVARPHRVALVGEPVELDGSRSWNAGGGPLRFEWRFGDGSRAAGPSVTRTYRNPGEYSEVLRVTDSGGSSAWDFAVVQVFEKGQTSAPTTIHAAFAPTTGVRPGDAVTFKVRTFNGRGGERWDFGDGSPLVRVRSDGNARMHDPHGYAVTRHRYDRPGDYIVTVEHVDSRGITATAHLHVRVEEEHATKENSTP